jgi:NAD(P)-dependent dehydrogenase (short-subunit alcohol dehydrogenase family)
MMSIATAASVGVGKPALLGQTLVVIGGSSGIGLETARRARAEGANVILTGRNEERLNQAASQVEAQSTAAFDANDPASIERFFMDAHAPIDHVMVTAGGPHYVSPFEVGFEEARAAISEAALRTLWVARAAHRQVRPAGTSAGGSLLASDSPFAPF